MQHFCCEATALTTVLLHRLVQLLGDQFDKQLDANITIYTTPELLNNDTM